MSIKISYFNNARAKKPSKEITIEQFLIDIKSKWKSQVTKLRETQSKKLKSELPAITLSGLFTSRDENLTLEKKLVAHSGFICIDIDSKDNPKLSTTHVIDHECAAQFVSCRGEGLKILYRCKHVYTRDEHWRIYDAVTERLKKKGIEVKIDSIVKSIQSLQYVTYDPNPYINLKTKLAIQPLKPIKLKKFAGTVVDVEKELAILNKFVDELGKKDITSDYEVWNNIAFGLSYSLGEKGREIFHKLSRNYKEYSENECNEKYDSQLQRDPSTITRPITLATVYDIIAGHLPAKSMKALKQEKGAAVGVGTGEECPDLAGMVQYRLFLFKKIGDKKTGDIKALTPHSINPIAFGKLLAEKNIFRFENAFVRIVDNVIEKVDANTILWEISKYVEQEGNYEFTYKGDAYVFNWEDLLYIWKQAKTHSGIGNSIASEVPFWKDNLLKDDNNTSYIPYLNGVVKVTAKKFELLKYSSLQFQIWKDRIIPRDFKYSDRAGMFEKFFGNVIGRGKNSKQQKESIEFQRGYWYYGYMLHSFKRESNARAFMLYDIKAGNNGRTGKSIIGTALGKIRFVTVIDGKQIDFRNRFWLQTVKPWTDIIFIDDPRVNTSLTPMFNMITGGVSADRKGLPPLEITPKFLIASNWVMGTEDDSEAGRQFISQLSSFYKDYAKENETITPIVDFHGKTFFSGWDDKDWNEFDSFSVRALQNYFSQEQPKELVLRDATTIQFIQRYGEDSFAEIEKIFKEKGEMQLKRIQRDYLLDAIRKFEPNMSSNKIGQIARTFLKSMGCENVKADYQFINRLDVFFYTWTNFVKI